MCVARICAEDVACRSIDLPCVHLKGEIPFYILARISTRAIFEKACFLLLDKGRGAHNIAMFALAAQKTI